MRISDWSSDVCSSDLFVVEGYTLENYVTFFSDAYYLGVFFTTIKVALICTLVCLVLGFPLAYVLALAAYNAGPSRARNWIEHYGDPRDPAVDRKSTRLNSSH